jgi:endonuclease G
MRTLTFFILLVISTRLFAQLELPRYGADDTIIRHRGYTLSYNSKYKQANWVAYLLTKDETVKRFQRGEYFAPDPLIPDTDFKVDYLKSGYDRGHLAPAADMGWSIETMVQSFFYSNMSPQVPRFNRGVWKKLEMHVRNWAVEYDSLYVVTGPIFDSVMPTIGPHRVAVPKSYYKVLLQKRNGEWFGVGFVMPNTKLKVDIMNYATSIAKVEGLTGLDFFWGLEDQIELLIENKYTVTVRIGH